MLATVFGQAAAQACVDMHGRPMASQTAGEQTATHQSGSGDRAAQAAAMAPCGGDAQDANQDTRHCDSTASVEDCGPGCTCCPGHCASALPVAEQYPHQPPRAIPASAYREITSTPVPESEFRPPIPA